MTGANGLPGQGRSTLQGCAASTVNNLAQALVAAWAARKSIIDEQSARAGDEEVIRLLFTLASASSDGTQVR